MSSGMLSFESGGGAFPCLSLKAWNGRLMVAFFQVVLQTLCSSRHLQPEDESLKEELVLASAATTAVTALLHHMETSPRYLTEQQAALMKEACTTYLRLYQVLAFKSAERRWCRWKAIPKMHLLLHLVEDQCKCKYNMRFFGCFQDEDFVGQFKLLVAEVPKELLEYRCMTRFLLRLEAMQ